jgi:hypothetical protein
MSVWLSGELRFQGGVAVASVSRSAAARVAVELKRIGPVRSDVSMTGRVARGPVSAGTVERPVAARISTI